MTSLSVMEVAEDIEVKEEEGEVLKTAQGLYFSSRSLGI